MGGMGVAWRGVAWRARARARAVRRPLRRQVCCARTFSTLRTLKRTVLESGRHSPTVTTSPSLMRKAGEAWAETVLCRFS